MGKATKLGLGGRTSREREVFEARLNLLLALDQLTPVFTDAADLSLEELSDRYPRLSGGGRSWILDCIGVNRERWEAVREYRGRYISGPLGLGDLPPHVTLEASFVFELRAEEQTMTEATRKMEKEFSEWIRGARKSLVADLREVYTAPGGKPSSARREDTHFVWAAEYLAGASTNFEQGSKRQAINDILALTDLWPPVIERSEEPSEEVTKAHRRIHEKVQEIILRVLGRADLD